MFAGCGDAEQQRVFNFLSEHNEMAPVFNEYFASDIYDDDGGGECGYHTSSYSGHLYAWAQAAVAIDVSLVKDIVPGTGNSNVGWIAGLNGIALFSANDGSHGAQLWRSDGTAAGTVMVKDINPGSGSSGPYGMLNVDGTVFFRANDGTNGTELWKSDGTATGTVMVKDIAAGSTSSIPGTLTDVDSALFFVANDVTHGNELWTTNKSAPTISIGSLPASTQANNPILLSLTVKNTHWGPISGMGFSIALPGNVVAADSTFLVSTCKGTLAATPGSHTITFSNGTLPLDGQCLLNVAIEATALGDYALAADAPYALETGEGAPSNPVSFAAIAWRLLLPALLR